MKQKTILEVRNMTKTFGSTIALNKVNLDVQSGEVLGLIGENGSGKSTVTSIAAGMQKADEGVMTFKGKAWNPVSMIDALDHGIGMIVQESGTVPGISVAENIFLGEIRAYQKHGFINRKEMLRAAQSVLDDIGADISAAEITSSLDMQERKLVEIAKVWRRRPTILIVDETTTALSQKGREIIYRLMEKMKKEGNSVIFISHDLDEIKERCDRLTVLRDGEIIRTFMKEEFDDDAIRSSMIGRQFTGSYYREDWDGSCSDKVVLSVKHVNEGNALKDFSVDLHAGEILGIGGLSDCGMHTLGKVMFGAVHPVDGTVEVHGKPLRNEAMAMAEGIGYVSKDRDYESLVLNASVNDNIASGGLDKIARHGVITPKREADYVNHQIHELQIKCQNRNQYVSALSGGNKQKVVFGKWIGRGSEILILDCPTRGIDIGVKQMMYQLMYRLKKQGKSIVIISEEMAELIGMADRIVIIRDGVNMAQISRNTHPQESDVIRYMI